MSYPIMRILDNVIKLKNIMNFKIQRNEKKINGDK